jgi:hypothetical protein
MLAAQASVYFQSWKSPSDIASRAGWLLASLYANPMVPVKRVTSSAPNNPGAGSVQSGTISPAVS